MTDYVLALDQGTTSFRAIQFDRAGQLPAASAVICAGIPPALSRPVRVEHDPDDIWTREPACARGVPRAPINAHLALHRHRPQCGTTLVWERAGRPTGFRASRKALAAQGQCERRVEPVMAAERRKVLLARWNRAVQRAMAWEQPL